MSEDKNGSVRVRLYAAARVAAGHSEIEAQPATAQEILRIISGGDFKTTSVFARCSILVDSELLHDLTEHVNAGEVMDVLPPFAGGSI